MKLLKFLFSLIIILSISVASAQSKKVDLKNLSDLSVFRYGQQAVLKTTDSANHYIDSVVLAANEAGIATVEVVGFDSTNAVAVTGSQVVRYSKVAGTLTLGSPSNILAKVTDTGLGTATFSINAVNNNIYILVKGKLTYTVKWVSLTHTLRRVRSS
jgi:hypothetical protein